jgi:hypothetical protein
MCADTWHPHNCFMYAFSSLKHAHQGPLSCDRLRIAPLLACRPLSTFLCGEQVLGRLKVTDLTDMDFSHMQGRSVSIDLYYINIL